MRLQTKAKKQYIIDCENKSALHTIAGFVKTIFENIPSSLYNWY